MANTHVCAQTILSGTVRDVAGQPLAGVLLEAETKAQPPSTAFVVSATDGSFTLKLAATPVSDSMYLHARALGYAAQRLGLVNRSQTVPLVLQAIPTQLREVTVRSAPITRHRDTLSYTVSAFTGKQDRVIADVLKKMPGIEVDGDGRISYQGNLINKFYINGQDLLEGRYSLASNNLPAEAVQSVQVLERHQPIRALDSLNRPDNAALNLQLKRKVTATGQVQLGAGWGPAPLGALWSANLAPMLFAGRQQLLDTYQTNNTGQDISTQLRALTAADFPSGNESSSQKPDLTHIVGLGRPPAGASRYLFNQVHLLSANHLIPVGPENQLRVNASYLHDVQTARGGSQTQFFLPDNRTVTLTEAKATQATFRQLLADLAFSKNVRRYYLKNTLSLDGRWDAQTGNIYRPETGLRLAQEAHNPFLALTNRLRLVRPLGGGPLLQLSSLTRFSNSPQELAVSPGPFAPLLAGGVAYDSVRQQAQLAAFSTTNSAGLTFRRGNWHWSGQVGFSQEVQRLSSALTTTTPEPTTVGPLRRNRLHWNHARYYIEPGLSRNTDRWSLSLRVPLSYYGFRATDAPLEASQRLRAVVAEPSLNLTRPLGRHWQVSADGSLSNMFGDINQLSYGYLLRDYRTMQRNDAPLARTQTQRYAGSIYFQDPLRSRFFYTSYAFSSALSNRLYSSQINADGALTTMALDRANRANSHLLSANLSQFISPWKTNLSFQVLGNLRQQPQMLNGRITNTRTQSGTASLKASILALAWGSVEGRASLTTLRSQITTRTSTPALVQEHQASASLFPVGGHQLTLSIDYYDSHGPAPTVRALFADVLYRYALPTKGRKIDLELRWDNIFDIRKYQYSFVSPFQLAQTTYEFRPAQVLASARMSL
ncbi:carboxypeptidase-like regulatory domain-containing protein [Hymenobacter actinosclerus]|uniref:carboxypeptidase-like regulatory domain-containing protein n=1 Tax=Hymenobacter actinosclerus TaxID=82805 RepID=UPI0015A5D99F|nr:carboxypeptidase-like regulatory domain-containing protein [Hymenobacter actinosclerus]